MVLCALQILSLDSFISVKQTPSIEHLISSTRRSPNIHIQISVANTYSFSSSICFNKHACYNHHKCLNLFYLYMCIYSYILYIHTLIILCYSERAKQSRKPWICWDVLLTAKHVVCGSLAVSYNIQNLNTLPCFIQKETDIVGLWCFIKFIMVLVCMDATCMSGLAEQ